MAGIITLGMVRRSRCYLGQGRWYEVLPWAGPVAGFTLGRAGGWCYLGQGCWHLVPWAGLLASATLGRIGGK